MKKSLILCLCCVGVLLAGCGKQEETQEISVPIYEAKTVSYRTEKAEIGDIPSVMSRPVPTVIPMRRPLPSASADR